MKSSEAIRIGIKRTIGRDMMTQKQLAERINMKPQQLSRYLTGTRCMRLDTLDRICDGLDRTLMEVLELGQ